MIKTVADFREEHYLHPFASNVANDIYVGLADLQVKLNYKQAEELQKSIFAELYDDKTYEELDKENIDLKVKIETLEEENDDLQQRLESLRSKLGIA